EDGIRHRNVTGVQTCALPISAGPLPAARSVPTATSRSRCRSLPRCHRHCSRQGPAPLPPARKKSSSPESSSTLLALRVRMGKGLRTGQEDLSAVEPQFTILSLLKVLANIARDGRNGKRCTVKSAQSTKARGVNPSDLRRINEGVVLAAMGPSHQ